jgi:hypothetical protein
MANFNRSELIQTEHRTRALAAQAHEKPGFVPDRSGELTLAEKRRLVADFGREALIRYGSNLTLPEAFQRD